MMRVDWQEIEQRLFAHGTETIHRFASEHPDAICSFLAYDVDLPFFALSFDTPANALQVAQRTEQEAIARRAKMLTTPAAWRVAQDVSTQPPVMDYSSSPDLFAFYDFAHVSFEALEDVERVEIDEAARSIMYGETTEDYIDGHVRVVLWRVIERLIDSDELHALRLASPCRLGYQMHDEYLTTLRILKWPQIS